MKVHELLEKLKQIDPGLDVICYTEDEELKGKGQTFKILDIVAVDVTHGQLDRLEDNTPTIVFKKGPASKDIAALEVTADF